MAFLTKWDKAAKAFAKWLENTENRDVFAAPRFSVRVQGIEVPIDDYVQEVEVDNTNYIISMIEVRLANPNFDLIRIGDQGVAAKELKAPHPEWVSYSLFQVGHIMEVWASFGGTAGRGLEQISEMQPFLGRDGTLQVPIGVGVISRHSPEYPESGMPSFTIRAYTYEWVMAGRDGAVRGLVDGKAERDIVSAPKQRKDTATGVQRKGSIVESKQDLGTTWGTRKAKMTHSEIVAVICKRWNIRLDLGESFLQESGEKYRPPTKVKAGTRKVYVGGKPASKDLVPSYLKVGDVPDQPKMLVSVPGRAIYKSKIGTIGFGPTTEKGIIVQTKASNDFEFCRDLARINGRECWVEYDWDAHLDGKPGKWVMHWHRTALHGTDPKPVFQFNYALQGQGSLLNLSPDFASDDKPEQIRAAMTHPYTGEVIAALEMDPRDGKLIWRYGGGQMKDARGGYTGSLYPRPDKPRQGKRNLVMGGSFAQQSNAAKRGATGVDATKGGFAASSASIRRGMNPSSRYLRDARNSSIGRKNLNLIRTSLKLGTEVFVQIGKFAFSYTVRPGQYKGDEGFDLMRRDIERIITYYKNSFMVGHGAIIGNPFVRAGQVNYFGGMSPRINGKWEMKQAKHVYSKSDGVYKIDFHAARLVETIRIPVDAKFKNRAKKIEDGKKVVLTSGGQSFLVTKE